MKSTTGFEKAIESERQRKAAFSGTSESDCSAKLEELAKHSAIVSGCLLSGGNAEDCVDMLCQCMEAITKQNIDLMMRSPFKIKTSDGKTLIWRCPDDLVPYRTMPNIRISEED